MTPKSEPPAWHLRCKHCGAFALVEIGMLKRGAPPPGPFCHSATGSPVARRA
jgi:hypothetical protein